MKNLKAIAFYLLITVLFTNFSNTKIYSTNQTEPYSQETKKIFDEIVSMDSIWEDAYNHCKVEKLSGLLSNDLEFYHDRGGLSTSKDSVMNAYKRNVCGKVTRELLKGSIEVSPIPGYGAVEMGKHRFYTNVEEKNNNQHFSRFVHIWKYENGHWIITRVISLH